MSAADSSSSISPSPHPPPQQPASSSSELSLAAAKAGSVVAKTSLKPPSLSQSQYDQKYAALKERVTVWTIVLAGPLGPLAILVGYVAFRILAYFLKKQMKEGSDTSSSFGSSSGVGHTSSSASLITHESSGVESAGTQEEIQAEEDARGMIEWYRAALILRCEEYNNGWRELQNTHGEVFLHSTNAIQKACIISPDEIHEVVDSQRAEQAGDQSTEVQAFKMGMMGVNNQIISRVKRDLERDICVKFINEDDPSQNFSIIAHLQFISYDGSEYLSIDLQEWSPLEGRIDQGMEQLRFQLETVLNRRGCNEKECFLQSLQMMAACSQMIFGDYQSSSFQGGAIAPQRKLEILQHDKTSLPRKQITVTAKRNEVIIQGCVWMKLFIKDGDTPEIWRTSVILSDRPGSRPQYVIEPELEIDLRTGKKRPEGIALAYDPRDSALKRVYLPMLLAVKREPPDLLPDVEFRIPGLSS